MEVEELVDAHPYYDRKISQGKRYDQALLALALARRRSDVLYAMFRDGTLYQRTDDLSVVEAA